MQKYKCTIEHVKEKTESYGWFREQLWLIEGVINGRWPYWLSICLNRTIGNLPDWAIPQIDFITCVDENKTAPYVEARLKGNDRGRDMLAMIGTASDAKKHLLKIFERCLRQGGYLQQLIDWWLYAFGSSQVKEKPRLHDEAQILLYSELQLYRLIGNPADWGSVLGLEFLGNSKKSSGWFPTPMNVVVFMVKMVMGDGDCRTKSVLDPCVGTGNFLLEASNYSLNLYGIDIDPLMVSLCEFAGWLYMPWLVWGNKQLITEFIEAEQRGNAGYEINHTNNEIMSVIPKLKAGQEQGLLFAEMET